MMAKVAAMKRTKNWRAELVQEYIEEIEWDALPNDDDTEEDDSGYESENWGEPWKNYKDEKYITNKESKIVLHKKSEENTVWDFSYLKTWFSNQENYVYPLYCPCGKIHKPWLEKECILSIIEDDLGDIGLCHKRKFDKRVSFFDHLRQKAQWGSVLHYGLMQYLHIIFPNHIKAPKKNKVSPSMNIEFNDTNFKTFCIHR